MRGKCNKCGCTHDNPCHHPEHGCCWWVNDENDLCSHCAIDEISTDPTTEHCVNYLYALTVKQPYASLIVGGIKDIENRTWLTNFRGRILIHAAAQPYKKIACEVLNSLQYANVFTQNKLSTLNGPNGSIIGSVEIIDCVVNHASIWAEKHYVPFKPYNWVLANPILFEKPIPAKGRLQIWKYDKGLSQIDYMDNKK